MRNRGMISRRRSAELESLQAAWERALPRWDTWYGRESLQRALDAVQEELNRRNG